MKSLLLVFAVALACVACRAEELPVSLAGQYHEPVNAYKIGSSYFLNAKQIGGLYGAQVYWYPVSGRVQISLRGRTLQLLADSDKATLDGKPARLGAAVMLRSAQAYVPLSFLEGQEFSDWAGFDTSFNPRTKLVAIERRATVGPPRWFSYGRFTRLSMALSKGLKYSASKRGLSGVKLTIPMGAIESPDKGAVGDGIIEEYELSQNAKAATLAVVFARRGAVWRIQELAEPRRVVIDVFEGEPFETPTETAVAAATSADKPRLRRKIIIDPGHGGKDPGASGRHGTREKDVNLAAALQLAKLLREEGAFDVTLTRDDDTFVPLADRSRKANELGADLFVSLHSNSATDPRESGFEVYFLSEQATDPEAQRVADAENASLELEGKTAQDAQAEVLLSELAKTETVNAASELAALTARAIEKRVDVADRGVKQAGFYVLRGTHAPAILCEMAFLSNAKEEVKLQSRRFRRRFVEGVYAGILDYARRQEWIAPPQQKVTGK